MVVCALCKRPTEADDALWRAEGDRVLVVRGGVICIGCFDRANERVRARVMATVRRDVEG